MDLGTFRAIVDRAPPGIAACGDDLESLYRYVELDPGSHMARHAVSDALYARIRDAFSTGHAAVRQHCRSLRTDLIREHVLQSTALDPYFDVLDRIAHAVRAEGTPPAEIEGDWDTAVRAALDAVSLQSWGDLRREDMHARDFKAAQAARALRDAGFDIEHGPGSLRLHEASEERLLRELEALVAGIGGINVARRMFAEITSVYDQTQQRYHLVRHVSMTGGGVSQMPWGYLLQLAAKHFQGRRPLSDTPAHWARLKKLIQAYAAVLDVQPYSHSFFGTMDARGLVAYLQETALYDTLFRLPQIRPADAVRISKGIFDWIDPDASTPDGWSINQVISVISAVLSRDVRGPIIVDAADIRRACPDVPRGLVQKILDDVLSHPPQGASQKFSRPTDAPTPGDPTTANAGITFFSRPLLRQTSRKFVLLDRSVCAPACIEALMAALRPHHKKLDDLVGPATERFLMGAMARCGVTALTGDYDAADGHGECDLVVEAPEKIMFFEVKKKPLTRPARAGSDAHLLLDLAGSLLFAQAQAGWHEVRLRREGHLDLDQDGQTVRVDRGEREIERVAVSLFDFGSFGDRMFLAQFLETTLNVEFTPANPALAKSFKKLNEALAEIREQLTKLHPGRQQLQSPFMHCWFLSAPQLLVLLDGVTDTETFTSALWSSRHLTTGSSDFYQELAYARMLEASHLSKPVQQG